MLIRIKSTILTLVLAASASLPAPDAQAGFVAPRAVGTWQITGTPDPNACNVTSPFTNFAVIGRDGTLVNTDPVVGTAVGEAFRIRRATYGVGFFGFIAPAPGILFKYEVQGTLRISWGGTASGRFRTIVTDVSGALPPCVYEGTIDAEKLSPLAY